MVNDKENPIPEMDDFPTIAVKSVKYWKVPTDSAFKEMYDSHGVAFKATQRYIGDLFNKDYEISGNFENIRKELNLDKYLKIAGKYAYRDGYSLLYLGFTDSGNYEDEINQSQVPESLFVIPKSWVKEDLNYNGENRDYYTIYHKTNNIEGDFKLHKSRVIRVRLREDEKSMYYPAFRSLNVCDNILWSVGQSYFRNAAGLLHLSVENPQKVKVDGVLVSEIQQIKSSGVFRDINAETAYISDARHKLEAKGINGGGLDPITHWEVALQSAAMSLQIPWQLIIGANAGAITGSETNLKEYFAMISNERESLVFDLLTDIAERFGISTPLEIEFGTLFEETDIERATMFKTTSEGMIPLVEKGIVSRESALLQINDKFGTKFTIGEIQQPQNNFNLNSQKSGDQLNLKPKIIGTKVMALKEIRFSQGIYTQTQAEEILNNNNIKYISSKKDEWDLKFIIRNESDFVPGTESYDYENGVESIEAELRVERKTDATKYPPTKWESPSYENFIIKAEDLVTDLVTDISFGKELEKSIKGSVLLADTLKNLTIERKISNDAEKEAKLVIEAVIDTLDKALKLELGVIILKGFDKGWVKSEEELKIDIPFTDRHTAIADAMKEDVMDLVTGASENMKKDMKVILHNHLINEKSVNAVTKAFRAYVSDEFAEKYTRRMRVIARTEILRTYNKANFSAYKESGLVEKVQWLTAGDDRVRPTHRAANGEIVELGKKFSLGVIHPPHGVLCRCTMVAKFDD